MGTSQYVYNVDLLSRFENRYVSRKRKSQDTDRAFYSTIECYDPAGAVVLPDESLPESKIDGVMSMVMGVMRFGDPEHVTVASLAPCFALFVQRAVVQRHFSHSC